MKTLEETILESQAVILNILFDMPEDMRCQEVTGQRDAMVKLGGYIAAKYPDQASKMMDMIQASEKHLED